MNTQDVALLFRLIERIHLVLQETVEDSPQMRKLNQEIEDVRKMITDAMEKDLVYLESL